MKDISLTLRPVFASAAADKAIHSQQKALASTQTTMERINKESKKGLKDQEDGWHRLTKATQEFGRQAVRAFDGALGGINGFQRKIEGGIKSIFNLHNVILGTVAGAAAYKLGGALFSQGAQQVHTKRALNREFGNGLLRDSIISQSKIIGDASGLQDDDTIQGLLPIARAIRETRIGDRVGKHTIRTKSQLEAVQKSQFMQAAGRFKQLAVLNPEMSPEQIGFLLAEAGQGPEGLRGLAGALHLGRGTMGDIKRDAAKSHAGVGDIMGVMFQRAGYTDTAVKSEQGSFEFQIKQVKMQFDQLLGDVGAKAIERLNERLGKGKSIAERFGEFLEKNKGTIDKTADGLARMVEKLADLAMKIPDALGWLEAHKTTLLAVGGAWAGLKVIGGARNLIGGALGGTAGKVADALGVGGEGQRVFVTNWPGSFGGSGGPSIPKIPLPAAAALGAGATIALGTAAGVAASLTALVATVAPLNNAMPQVREETANKLSMERMGRVSAIVRAAERSGGEGSAFATALGPALMGKIGQDPQLQKIASSIVNRQFDPGLDPDMAAGLRDATKGTSLEGQLKELKVEVNLANPLGLANAGIGDFVKRLMPQLEEGITRKLAAQFPAQ